MDGETYQFAAELWETEAFARWRFVTVPQEIGDEIEFRTSGQPRAGFGAVAVVARIGVTTWHTSIFPDAGREAYVLAVKKSVRRAEDVDLGDTVQVTLELELSGRPADRS